MTLISDSIDTALGTGNEATNDTPTKETPEKETPAEVEVPEVDEEEDADEDDTGLDTDDEDAETEEETPSTDDTPPKAFKAPSLITNLKKEFPTFAKKYPQVIDAYFQLQEYHQVYGSVDDAKLSAEKADVMDGMLSSLDEGEIAPVLDVLYERDPASLSAVVENFLPTLNQRSPELFKKVVAPVVRNVLARVAAQAQRSNDEQLLIATQYINRAIFGDENVPKPTKFESTRREVQRQPEGESPTEKLFYNHVTEYIDPILDKEINMGLDPDNAYPEGLREIAIKEIKKRVFLTLRENESHMRTMTALKKSAVASEFSKEYQRKIARAVVNASKEIIPSIRAKVKKKLFGNMSIGKRSTDELTNAPNIPSSNGKPATVAGSSNRSASAKFDLHKDSLREAMDKVLPT